MSLHKSSVLVKLTIRNWNAFKRDRIVSERVDEQYRTAGDAGNYNKRLLGKDVLKPVTTILSKARTEHDRMTMPWCYDGVSLLPSQLYFQYTETMRRFSDLLAENLENLVQQYPVHKANRAAALNGMYNPEDYPSRDELRSRYSLSYRFFPVPQSDHFIVDVAAAEADKMKAALQRDLADTQSAALKDLYDRVIKLATHAHERLSDPQNVFRDSLVENLTQMVNVLPKLNVFNDPLLNRACEELKRNVLIADAADFRTDQAARKAAANSAFDVVALLKGEPAQMQKAA